jgi:hypothetical protein
MDNRRAYIVRIWQTRDGRVVGQVSDPEAGWRHPFQSAADLWAVVSGALLTSDPQPESRSDATHHHDE